MGENQPISSDQVQNVLGSEQVNAIATRMGVDPAMVSTFLAEYLPKIVDKLTPAGKIDPAADHQQGTGGFASIALAKPQWPIVRRPVRPGLASGQYGPCVCRGGCANRLGMASVLDTSTSTTNAFEDSKLSSSTCLCLLAFRC